MPATKWEVIAETVHQSIRSGSLQSGDSLPSEEKLAATWNVCRSTAHRAMNELKRKGVIVRKRRHGTVVADASKSTIQKIVLLSVADGDFLLVEYMRGIRAALPDNYEFTYFDSHNDPAREAAFLRDMVRDAAGIICLPTSAAENTPLLGEVSARIPLICIDRLPDMLDVSAVLNDNYESTYRALTRLANRGHRRIGFFGQDLPYISTIRERTSAFERVMRDCGADDVQKFECLIHVTSDFEQLTKSVQDALLTLTHLDDPVTAVFCQNEIFLMAVLEAQRRLGSAVRENLEIVSFCDMPPVMQYLARGVHRIVQQSYEAGRAAATQLLRQIGNPEEIKVVRISACLFEAGETTSYSTASAIDAAAGISSAQHASCS